MKRECSIDGCGRVVVARGWCQFHYNRWYGRGTTDPPRSITMEERLDSKIYRDGPNGCWIWQGHILPNGRGQFAPTRTTRTPAHRAVWKWLVGPIPDDLELDHLCRNTRCVNPEHLEPVTRLENIRRSVPYRDHLRPTHCKRGHERTPENLYTTTQGGKACRECNRIRNRERMRRLRQAKKQTSTNPR